MALDSDFEIQFFESILAKDPTYPEVIEILAGLYTQEGRIEEGLKMDQKLVQIFPEDPTAHYNLACSLALKNRFQDAVKALTQSVKLGYNDASWMEEDPDLEPLHDYPPFEALLERLRNGKSA